MNKQKVFYYSQNKNDEFMTPPKIIKSISGNYPYIRDKFGARLLAFVAYRLIATPLAFVYTCWIKRIKIVNKKILKPYRNDGYFIYANHTQVQADAFTPNIILFPKRNYTIVNANNVSLPLLGNATKLLGALPLPDDLEAGRNFIKAIDKRISQGYSVLIYPEAHIWPYYTDIREFDETSFRYPLKLDTPAFVFTTTYQKKRRGKCQIVIYVDGPFVAPLNLDKKARQIYLRNLVYQTMKDRVASSNYQKYIYKAKEQL